MPSDNDRERRGDRATLVALLTLLYAFMLVLFVKPRLVFGVWYDGGRWDAHMPAFLHAVFVAVRFLRAWFVAFSLPVVGAGILAWMGALDRPARALCGVVVTILIACAVIVILVRSEVAAADPLRRALLND